LPGKKGIKKGRNVQLTSHCIDSREDVQREEENSFTRMTGGDLH